MELQNLFYVVAIIFMTLGIIICATVIYFLWTLERSVLEFRRKVLDRAESLLNSRAVEVAGNIVGSAVSAFSSSRKKTDD